MSTRTKRRAAETCRMFESDLVERFSRIHPATPFVFWVPVGAYLLFRSGVRHDLSLAATVGTFLAGLFVWSLTEYTLHRYVFHWFKPTPTGRRVHFVLHGVHHDFPSDADRLVMPLGSSIPMGAVIYGLALFALRVRLADPFFAGMILGYLCYDGTHYAIHHFPQRTRVGKWLKKHHMLHHHVDHSGGFGVSSPLWDFVFGTMPQPKRAPVDGALPGRS